MADLTYAVAPVCHTAKFYATRIDGTHVYYGEMPRGHRYQHDWMCDCGGAGVNGCKHIAEAAKLRCGWNAGLEPYDGEAVGDTCPDCGGDLCYVPVGV